MPDDRAKPSADHQREMQIRQRFRALTEESRSGNEIEGEDRRFDQPFLLRLLDEARAESAQAVQRERERCLSFCNEITADLNWNGMILMTAGGIARKIAHGEPKP